MNHFDNTHLISAPLHASLDVTNRCMARCLHCFNRSGNELPRDELSDEEILNVIDQIAEMKLFSACFCGGEPLLRHKVLEEGARRYKRAGVKNISVVSNGWLMTESMAQGLAEAGMTMVQISLDGSTAETYERLRGVKGRFERALQAMRFVNDTKMDLSVAFCPTRFNAHQFPEVVELVKGFRNLTSIRMQPFMPMGKGAEADDILPTEEDYRTLVKYVEGFNMNRKSVFPVLEWGDPIDHLRRFVEIDFKKNSFIDIKADGMLSVSSYLPLRVGNLRKYTLREYWEAGLGKVWKLPVVRELAGNMLSLGDMSFKGKKLPKVFYDKDLQVDIIEDQPFANPQEFTLARLLEKQDDGREVAV